MTNTQIPKTSPVEQFPSWNSNTNITCTRTCSANQTFSKAELFMMSLCTSNSKEH